jgi:hypothetical protein
MQFEKVSTEPMRLVPMPGLRGLVLFFLIAIAATEVGLGVAIAEAWRNTRRGSGRDVVTIANAVERLNAIESVFLLGLLASAALWLVLLLVNTARATPRHTHENHLFVRGMFVSALVMTIALVTRARELLPPAASRLLAVSALIWAPFALIDGASIRLATSRVSVRSWYAMLIATLVIHTFFTSRFDLLSPAESSQTGRTALLHASSGLLMGLAALFAADTTNSLREAVDSKVDRYKHLVEDARVRGGRKRNGALATVSPDQPSAFT